MRISTAPAVQPASSTNTGVVPPWIQHPGNGGIVPPWLERDLGYTATHPTNSAQRGWYLTT